MTRGTGCGHFRSDPQPWARASVAPPDEQVTQAVTAIRAARQTLMLGMPAIPPAARTR
jgi:hypothetical protein